MLEPPELVHQHPKHLASFSVPVQNPTRIGGSIIVLSDLIERLRTTPYSLLILYIDYIYILLPYSSGVFLLVRVVNLAHRTSSNLHEPYHHRGSMRFAVLEPPRFMHKHPTHLSSSVWFM